VWDFLVPHSSQSSLLLLSENLLETWPRIV
jgi:hypothetical protein